MSEFDKEAEREKLREKYGDETDERAATQQMSELLLQGATMTNKHCDECGDPVFRHEGQEFCPTCQSEVADGTESGESGAATDRQAGSTPPAGDGADESAGSEASPSGASGAESPAASGSGVTPARGAEGVRDRTTGSTADRGGDDRADPPASGEQVTTASGGAGGGTTEPERGRASDTTSRGDELASAERSLARTLDRFARRAEGTDDPRAAREHLSAAREAAEALSALRR